MLFRYVKLIASSWRNALGEVFPLWEATILSMGPALHHDVRLLQILGSEAPLSQTFLPEAHTAFKDMISGADQLNSLRIVRDFAPEVYKVLTKGGTLHHMSDMGWRLALVKAISDRLQTYHDAVSESPDDGELHLLEEPLLRNPIRNLAFYSLTTTGKMYRSRPAFENPPSDKHDNSCHKRKLDHQPRRVTQLFLMLDVETCWLIGAHLNRDEGGRDVLNALYRFCPVSPSEVYYDNACNLFPFLMARLPKFFMKVKFFHDFFHGIRHVCECVWRSLRSRHEGRTVREVTSAAEQLNAFMSPLKRMSSNMTPTVFMWFCMHHAWFWNVGKLQRARDAAVSHGIDFNDPNDLISSSIAIVQ